MLLQPVGPPALRARSAVSGGRPRARARGSRGPGARGPPRACVGQHLEIARFTPRATATLEPPTPRRGIASRDRERRARHDVMIGAIQKNAARRKRRARPTAPALVPAPLEVEQVRRLGLEPQNRLPDSQVDGQLERFPGHRPGATQIAEPGQDRREIAERAEELGRVGAAREGSTLASRSARPPSRSPTITRASPREFRLRVPAPSRRRAARQLQAPRPRARSPARSRLRAPRTGRVLGYRQRLRAGEASAGSGRGDVRALARAGRPVVLAERRLRAAACWSPRARKTSRPPRPADLFDARPRAGVGPTRPRSRPR